MKKRPTPTAKNEKATILSLVIKTLPNARPSARAHFTICLIAEASPNATNIECYSLQKQKIANGLFLALQTLCTNYMYEKETLVFIKQEIQQTQTLAY